MAVSQLDTWQNTLDLLTLTAQKTGFLQKLNLLKRIEAVEVCCNDEFYREKLLNWISFTINNLSNKKTAEKALHFRIIGNKKFEEKKYAESVCLFTQSIQYSLPNSNDLALSFGNRSAALYYMDQFEDSLQDIERALKVGYAENLKYKLYFRKGECLSKLNKCCESIDAYKLALTYLEKADCISLSRRDTIKKQIGSALSNHSNLNPKEYNDHTFKKYVSKTVPSTKYGGSDAFLSASAGLELRFDRERGRNVFAVKEMNVGDILFVEKPYSLVVLPEYYTQHCHYCCKESMILLPCSACTGVLYCSEMCCKSAWIEHHKWECGAGMNLLHSVGIAHLALRVVLKANPLNSETKLRFIYQDPVSLYSETQSFGCKNDNYLAVYSLKEHIEDMEENDFFQYVLTAAMLTLYLETQTNYFKVKEYQNITKSNTQNMIPHDNDSINKNVAIVGRLILRHIAQLISNAHAITKLTADSSPDVASESQVRVATAIYPSVSMLNHSCNPNIISSFLDSYVIVRASRTIQSGSEVFNCYGPHSQRMTLLERQEALKAQYFFDCKCASCTNISEINFQRCFSALLCSICKGPLIEPYKPRQSVICKEKGHLECLECGLMQKPNDYKQLAEAEELFDEGCIFIEKGSIEQSIICFNNCLNIRQKILYKYNSDLTECWDQLAKCHALTGNFKKSIYFLQQSLAVIEVKFGENSIEIANELRKLCSVMIRDVVENKYNDKQFMIKYEEIKTIIKKAKTILQLIYGEWNNNFQDLIVEETELEFFRMKLYGTNCN